MLIDFSVKSVLSVQVDLLSTRNMCDKFDVMSIFRRQLSVYKKYDNKKEVMLNPETGV